MITNLVDPQPPEGNDLCYDHPMCSTQILEVRGGGEQRLGGESD